jgi:hypothetical protein
MGVLLPAKGGLIEVKNKPPGRIQSLPTGGRLISVAVGEVLSEFRRILRYYLSSIEPPLLFLAPF